MAIHSTFSSIKMGGDLYEEAPDIYGKAVMDSIKTGIDMSALIKVAALGSLPNTIRRYLARGKSKEYMFGVPYGTLGPSINRVSWDDLVLFTETHLRKYPAYYPIDLLEVQQIQPETMSTLDYCMAHFSAFHGTFGIVVDDNHGDLDLYQPGTAKRLLRTEFISVGVVPKDHYTLYEDEVWNSAPANTSYKYTVKQYTYASTNPGIDPYMAVEIFSHTYTTPTVGSWKRFNHGSTEVLYMFTWREPMVSATEPQRRIQMEYVWCDASNAIYDDIRINADLYHLGEYYPIIPIKSKALWYDEQPTFFGYASSTITEHCNEQYKVLNVGDLPEVKQKLIDSDTGGNLRGVFVVLGTNTYTEDQGGLEYLYHWGKNLHDTGKVVDYRSDNTNCNVINIIKGLYLRKTIFNWLEWSGVPSSLPEDAFEYTVEYTPYSSDHYANIEKKDDGNTYDPWGYGNPVKPLNDYTWLTVPHDRSNDVTSISKRLKTTGAVHGVVEIQGYAEMALTSHDGSNIYTVNHIITNAQGKIDHDNMLQHIRDHKDDDPIPDYTGNYPDISVVPFNVKVLAQYTTALDRKYRDTLYNGLYLQTQSTTVTHTSWFQKIMKVVLLAVKIYFIFTTLMEIGIAYASGGIYGAFVVAEYYLKQYVISYIASLIIEAVVNEIVEAVVEHYLEDDDTDILEAESDSSGKVKEMNRVRKALPDAQDIINNMPAYIEIVSERVESHIVADLESITSTSNDVKVAEDKVVKEMTPASYIESPKEFLQRALTIDVTRAVHSTISETVPPIGRGYISPMKDPTKEK